MSDRDKIYILHGHEPKAMALEMLRRLDPARGLKAGLLVGLKPNLVVAKPHSSGATTSADLVAGVVEYLKEKGVARIRIMESAGVGHDTGAAFRVTGLDKVAAFHGAELLDLKGRPAKEVSAGGFRAKVFRAALEVDFLINLPVVKAHSQTRITCALKNLKGLIPDSEKRRFHNLGLDGPIAGLNGLIRQDLILADGLNGDLTFEEGGTPVRMDRILLAQDPVLLDSFVAESLGYRVDQVEHVALSERLGLGRRVQSEEQIVTLNEPVLPPPGPKPERLWDSLAGHVEARAACSTCLGGLLHALERLRGKGRLERLKMKIRLGQGFKGVKGPGLGVGACAAGLERHVPGCPPRPVKIVEFLEKALAVQPGRGEP